mmetsp:Transcript_2946/g.6440  ORF Transcript_2946/g.6440 Transcript_2946/m.6440 type:complete len:99 (-) Transcript_2946:15-311(-)
MFRHLRNRHQPPAHLCPPMEEKRCIDSMAFTGFQRLAPRSAIIKRLLYPFHNSLAAHLSRRQGSTTHCTDTLSVYLLIYLSTYLSIHLSINLSDTLSM